MSTVNYSVSSLDQQSLPAVKRLVYSFTMKGLLSAEKQPALQRTVSSMGKDKGKKSDISSKEEWRENHPQIKSRLWPTFLTDLFWLWQKTALVHRLVSALKQFPQMLFFISHKNLNYDVVLSLFFAPSLQFSQSTNVMRGKQRLRLGNKNIIEYYFSTMHKYFGHVQFAFDFAY